LRGRAVRDAAPAPAGGPFPPLIVSHGYPGNRFLLCHLAENLASKGYVVASIGHTDSTYDSQGPPAGLAGIKTPVLFIAGSVDDVSGYAPGVRNLFEGAVNAPRYLLTFENANHNAGAPMPAPHETWTSVAHLNFVPAEHYSDAVWDNREGLSRWGCCAPSCT